MAKYDTAKAGKQFQLSLPPFKTKFACCDCGLVHRHIYEIKKTTKGPKGLTLWCTVLPDDRATAANRRRAYRRKGYYIFAIPAPRKRKCSRRSSTRKQAK